MQFVKNKIGVYFKIMMEGDNCLCLEETSNVILTIPRKDLTEVSVAEYLNNVPEMNVRQSKKGIDQDKKLFDDREEDDY